MCSLRLAENPSHPCPNATTTRKTKTNYSNCYKAYHYYQDKVRAVEVVQRLELLRKPNKERKETTAKATASANSDSGANLHAPRLIRPRPPSSGAGDLVSILYLKLKESSFLALVHICSNVLRKRGYPDSTYIISAFELQHLLTPKPATFCVI
jgi:hypothetical protein